MREGETLWTRLANTPPVPAITPADLENRGAVDRRLQHVSARVSALKNVINHYRQTASDQFRRAKLEEWEAELATLLEHRGLLKMRRIELDEEANSSWVRCFKAAAKEMLPHDAYERIIARANELEEARQRRHSQGLVGSAVPMTGAVAPGKRREA